MLVCWSHLDVPQPSEARHSRFEQKWGFSAFRSRQAGNLHEVNTFTKVQLSPPKPLPRQLHSTLPSEAGVNKFGNQNSPTAKTSAYRSAQVKHVSMVRAPVFFCRSLIPFVPHVFSVCHWLTDSKTVARRLAGSTWVTQLLRLKFRQKALHPPPAACI